MQDRYLCKARPIGTRKQWVTGFCAVLGEKTVIIVNEPEKFYDVDSGKNSHGNKIVEVIPKTVCWCTGLKDKNGTIIWENDIVKHYNDDAHPENYCTGTVLWDENYAGFYRTSNEYGLSKPRISSDCIYEVVGNVFDNQELLEEKYGDMQTQES